MSDSHHAVRLGGSEITFPKASHTVIRSLILTPETYQSYNLLEKREIDELPADTKTVIDRYKTQSSDCVPTLLEINYRSTDTLSTREAGSALSPLLTSEK